MPRCPLCGSAHIVVTFRPQRRGHCYGCDLRWGLDGGAPAAEPSDRPRSDPPRAASSD